MLGYVMSAFLDDGPPGHRITQASYFKIKEGMTEREVEDIFRVGAGCYDGEPPDEEFLGGKDMMNFQPPIPNRNRGVQKGWIAKGTTVYIEFDQDGRVLHKQLMITSRFPNARA
jgi:hypothetical protein